MGLTGVEGQSYEVPAVGRCCGLKSAPQGLLAFGADEPQETWRPIQDGSGDCNRETGNLNVERDGAGERACLWEARFCPSCARTQESVWRGLDQSGLALERPVSAIEEKMDAPVASMIDWTLLWKLCDFALTKCLKVVFWG